MDILVSGGSSGIGAAVVRQLAAHNRIFIIYNKGKERADALAAEVKAAGGTGIPVSADISTPQGCLMAIERVKDSTDKLDVLVNAAGGIVTRANTGSFVWDDIEKVFALNTFSVFFLCSLTVDMLKKSNRGVVINFASAAVYSGSAGAPLYASAKGAVDVYTRSLARELAPDVRVVTIAPGVVETPFHSVTTREMLDTWAAANPLKRNGKPEEIAQAVEFCINNSFLNGVSIDLNGGMRGV